MFDQFAVFLRLNLSD